MDGGMVQTKEGLTRMERGDGELTNIYLHAHLQYLPTRKTSLEPRMGGNYFR